MTDHWNHLKNLAKTDGIQIYVGQPTLEWAVAEIERLRAEERELWQPLLLGVWDLGCECDPGVSTHVCEACRLKSIVTQISGEDK